jgi:predicted nucleic acid-binding protein
MFLRLLTTEAVLARFGNPPLTNAQAWSVYQGLLADPRIRYAGEPPGLEPVWEQLALRDAASPKIWMDAYLASFAISVGYRLVTIDLAFKQYGGLDLILLTVP